jgi:hypothetical protein
MSPSLVVNDQLHLGSQSDVFKGGHLFLWRDDDGNLGLGRQALVSNTIGNSNTANGNFALRYNTEGSYNVAIGYAAMRDNVTGSANTASGYSALYSNTYGSYNTASGNSALFNNTEGSYNTGSGYKALFANETGSDNTAMGLSALRFTTGERNTAIGRRAGFSSTSGSDNIFIGSGAEGVGGATPDSNTIRIGGTMVGDQAEQQNRTFINGIRGVTTGYGDALDVKIDSKGQLGTISSSRRHKEDITDMGAASDRLLALRPVTFRFKKAFVDGEKPLQFGLVAEEVAEVFPELVVYDDKGRPETVRYDLISTLLLNELQKQSRLNEAQADLLTELSSLKSEVALLRELAGGSER